MWTRVAVGSGADQNRFTNRAYIAHGRPPPSPSATLPWATSRPITRDGVTVAGGSTTSHGWFNDRNDFTMYIDSTDYDFL